MRRAAPETNSYLCCNNNVDAERVSKSGSAVESGGRRAKTCSPARPPPRQSLQLPLPIRMSESTEPPRSNPRPTGGKNLGTWY